MVGKLSVLDLLSKQEKVDREKGYGTLFLTPDGVKNRVRWTVAVLQPPELAALIVEEVNVRNTRLQRTGESLSRLLSAKPKLLLRLRLLPLLAKVMVAKVPGRLDRSINGRRWTTGRTMT